MRPEPGPAKAAVVAVCSAGGHVFSKAVQSRIRLLAGLGVEGDAHLGVTVQHRSRVKKDPTVPNLRQVHLIHSELFEELRPAGFTVCPGELGENITTRGVPLLDLPAGTRLRIGATAVVELTGLRNPCHQIDDFQPGLMSAVLGRDESGGLVRKSGVMSIVIADGVIEPGDAIAVELPATPHRALAPV